MGQDLEILPPVEDMSPLDFLKAVYRNEKLPLHARLRAAADAAPFCHAKLAVVANVSEDDLAERLMRAIERSSKVIEHRPTMQVIEPPKAEATQVTPSLSLRTPSLASKGSEKEAPRGIQGA
jgi:hypothetical protein